jgi:hypothetical protein
MMGIMGWSSSAMAHRYSHVVASIRTDIANKVDGLIWAEPTEQKPPEADRARAN